MKSSISAADSLEQTKIEDCFVATEKLLFSLCHKAITSYGGDFDDWFDLSIELFYKAWHLFNGKSSWSVWLYNVVWWGFYQHSIQNFYNKWVRTKNDSLVFCRGRSNNELVVEYEDGTTRGLKCRKLTIDYEETQRRYTDFSINQLKENQKKERMESVENFPFSKDARTVINLTINPPDICPEYPELAYDPVIVEETVKHYCLYALKWSRGRLNKAWSEIQEYYEND